MALFNLEELCCFSMELQTPLHDAAEGGYLEVVKHLIECGSDVNSIWDLESLRNRSIVSALVFNFNDPYFQNFVRIDDIPKSDIDILIENGMI